MTASDRLRGLALTRRPWFDRPMTTFGSPLQQFAHDSGARYWVGPTPRGGEDQIVRNIARHLGYPTARIDPFAHGGLVRLDRRQAAHVLAVAGTTSLAYEQPVPSEDALRSATRALAQLAADATFLGNGFWDVSGPIQWTPLSNATFDCGVIGYDERNAFIVWVEEED